MGAASSVRGASRERSKRLEASLERPGSIRECLGSIQECPGSIQEYPGSIRETSGRAEPYPLATPNRGEVPEVVEIIGN